MKAHFLAGMILIAFLVGCTPSTSTSSPEWVVQLIQKFEHELVGNPPQSIWSYEYHKQVVYFVPAQCCDQFSTLYDASGTALCAPDGGLTGKGDGKCTDFFDQRSNEQLVWKDSRTR